MTEQTPEPEAPAVVEPSELETVARLAAEAVVRALPPRPDHEDRITAAEQQITALLQLLTAAAGPEGNAAKLAGRLDQVEAGLQQLLTAEPKAHPEQQQLIEDLRLKVAKLERNTHGPR